MRTGAHTIFIQFSDASTPLDNGLLHPHHPGDTPHANAVLHIRDKSQRNIPTCTATSRGESKGPLRRGTGGEQGRRRQQDGQDVRYRYVHPACPQSTKTPLTNPPVLIVKPSASTTIRHNGEQGTPPPPPPPTQLTPPPPKKDAIIHATSGTGLLLSSPPDNLIPPSDATSSSSSSSSDKPERHVLSQGDFAVVPAWTEHQIVNESDTVELHWIVTRSGPSPVEVNLTGWGGSELQAETEREGERGSGGEREGQGPG